MFWRTRDANDNKDEYKAKKNNLSTSFCFCLFTEPISGSHGNIGKKISLKADQTE